MVKGKGHRIDSGKILVVEKVLLTRQPSALATEIGGQRPDHRVEDGDRRHLNPSAAFLQQLTKRVTNQREQNNALVRLDSGDDALNLVEELLGPSPALVDEIICLSGVPNGTV